MMKKDEVEFFIKIQSQMEELYNEISILSKKSQLDALNDFKLSFVWTLPQSVYKVKQHYLNNIH
jgi:thiamine biosynthesis lipoprotein ApbE